MDNTDPTNSAEQTPQTPPIPVLDKQAIIMAAIPAVVQSIDSLKEIYLQSQAEKSGLTERDNLSQRELHKYQIDKEYELEKIRITSSQKTDVASRLSKAVIAGITIIGVFVLAYFKPDLIGYNLMLILVLIIGPIMSSSDIGHFVNNVAKPIKDGFK